MKLTQIANQAVRISALTIGFWGAGMLSYSAIAAGVNLLPENPTTIAEPEALELVETYEECLRRKQKPSGAVPAGAATACALATASATPSIDQPNTTMPEIQSSVEVSDAALLENGGSTTYDDRSANVQVAL